MTWTLFEWDAIDAVLLLGLSYQVRPTENGKEGETAVGPILCPCVPMQCLGEANWQLAFNSSIAALNYLN